MAQRKAPDVRKLLIPVPVNAEERKKFQKLAADRHKSMAQLIRELLYRVLEGKIEAA